LVKGVVAAATTEERAEEVTQEVAVRKRHI
jgi:hypothetical protein